MSSSSGLAASVQSGFAPAAAYDAHRPSYPSEAVHDLLSELGLLTPASQRSCGGGYGDIEGPSEEAALAGASTPTSGEQQHDTMTSTGNNNSGSRGGGGSTTRIVELASGTGKFTELLAQQTQIQGNGGGGETEIVAVEPHAEMRRQLEQKRLRGVKVVEGGAGELDIRAGDAENVLNLKKHVYDLLQENDARLAANDFTTIKWGEQAFHWFATEEALREIHRILRPGASFGVIWNIESYNQPPSWSFQTSWEKDLSDMIMKLDDGHARFRHMKWMEVFDKQLKSNPLQALRDGFMDNDMPRFSLPLGSKSVPWTVWIEPTQLWQRLNTLSQLVVMNEEEKAHTKEEFDRAMAREDVEKNDKGEIALHGCTYYAWTQAL